MNYNYSKPSILYSAQNKLAYDLWNVSYHDVVKVKSLLGQGADPNHQLYWSEKWYWEPPLHTACKWGRLEIVKTLVTHGARTDKGDGGDNMTPLHWACRGDCIEVVKYFIQEVGCSIGKCNYSRCNSVPRAMFEGPIFRILYIIFTLYSICMFQQM